MADEHGERACDTISALSLSHVPFCALPVTNYFSSTTTLYIINNGIWKATTGYTTP